MVGFTAPNLQTPLLVQGSASPVGTIFSNHSIFSIQSELQMQLFFLECTPCIGVNGVGVNRPGRNGTYVYFNDATMNNTAVLQYDCGWSPFVTYSGSTIIIYAPYAWLPGHTYFVTFDSGLYFHILILWNSRCLYFIGASSGTDFCRK